MTMAAAVVETLGPGLLGVRTAGDEFPSGAIEDVVEGIAIGHGDQFARGIADVGFEEHGHVGGIPIVRVVGGELEVPLEFAGVAIERHEGTGI
jgi:hypothetical protein